MANNKIGALWLNKSRTDGKQYLAGQVELGGVKHKIVVFKNDHKKQDTHPDYNIVLSQPQGQQQPQQQQSFEDDVPF
jgi:uncharacterized protein (DUF736 family)